MPEETRTKHVSESATEQVHIIMPLHLNSYGRLFGGQMALWIDELAGVVARRHCNQQVTTVLIDSLRFKAPVFQDSLIHMYGKVTFVGNTSFEVRVDSYAESLDGQRELINTAFVILVAIDENGRPQSVPQLVLSTLGERREFEHGRMRNELRRELSEELYS